MIKKSILSLTGLAISFGSLQAANVLVVGEHTAASAQNADLIALLGGAGHAVSFTTGGSVGGDLTQIYSGTTTRAEFLNSFDVVVLSRLVGSGSFQSDIAETGWAALTTGVVNASAYVARETRLGFVNDEGIVLSAYTGSETTVLNSSHSIWSGITITAGAADLATQILDPSASNAGSNWATLSGSVGDGEVLGRVGTAASIVTWETGDLLGGGETAAGRRVFFTLNGYANPTANSPGNTEGLTADGRAAFLNAVTWASVPEPSAMGLLAASGLLVGFRRNRRTKA